MMIQIAKQIILTCPDNRNQWEDYLLKIIQYHNPAFLTILPLTSTVLFTISSDGKMTCLFHPAQNTPYYPISKVQLNTVVLMDCGVLFPH